MVVEQEETLKALKTAIQMEIDGKEFYLKASKSSSNDLGKKLLNTLASEEDHHRQNFERVYESIRAKKQWPDVSFKPDGGRGLRNVFAKSLDSSDTDIKTIPTELDAVETAMAMENKTHDFYINRAKAATYDAERDLYEALAAQESEHHLVLLDYYEFLKDPAAWFVEKEHHSLDGG